jgi:hypothetical protein
MQKAHSSQAATVRVHCYCKYCDSASVAMPDLQVASTRTELACAVACSAVTLSTVTEYPNLLYPVFQLQTRMRALTLDISGWEKVTARIDAINRQKAKGVCSSQHVTLPYFYIVQC